MSRQLVLVWGVASGGAMIVAAKATRVELVLLGLVGALHAWIMVDGARSRWLRLGDVRLVGLLRRWGLAVPARRKEGS
jgi:hypothetical protein